MRVDVQQTCETIINIQLNSVHVQNLRERSRVDESA